MKGCTSLTAHYRHLTIDDRIEIQTLHDRGKSKAEISRRIGVHRSTISREFTRGSWQPEHDHANLRPYLRNRLDTRRPRSRLYLGHQAHLQAQSRGARSHQPHRMRRDRLVDWVIKRLEKGWTPQEISGRLGIEFPSDARMRVSTEVIYAWIYAPAQQHRQLWQYLPRGAKKRRRRQGRRVHSERIKWRTSIHERPAEVSDRSQFGHWESDSVLGVHGTGALHTTVERVSRYVCAVKLPGATAQATLDAQLAIYAQFPAHASRSVTADNGSEFTWHYRLADTIGVPPISRTPTRLGNEAPTSTSTVASANTCRNEQASLTFTRLS
jgi:IS30 family transposase